MCTRSPGVRYSQSPSDRLVYGRIRVGYQVGGVTGEKSLCQFNPDTDGASVGSKKAEPASYRLRNMDCALGLLPFYPGRERTASAVKQTDDGGVSGGGD